MKSQEVQGSTLTQTHTVYLWLWTLLGYWAAPEQIAIQTVLLLVQLASEPNPLARVSDESTQGSRRSNQRRWNVDDWIFSLISGSYLADGSVRSPISHHDVGVEINVVQLYGSRPHGHSSANLTCDALGSTWRSCTQSQSLHNTLKIVMLK